ncbi:MAG: M64 family metallopeptidase [Candidatus Cryptobacteroides sp.]|jgi:hypothetical protein
MKKMFLILLTAMLPLSEYAIAHAAIPEALNMDRTLRIDCIFSGSAREQEISIAELRALDGWAGRRVNLDRPPLRGNGQITLRDTSGNILYSNAFSTLFQEWQTTEEATRVRKSFENVFLVPMPRVKAELTLKLFDTRGNTACEYSQTIDPADILIRPLRKVPAPHVWLWKGGDPLDGFEVDSARKIDVAIVAEGYTEAEMDRFLEDARATMESLWGHEPFHALKDRFNIVAVQVPSEESGVSVPREGVWKNTAVDSSFDTFYSARYLTTLHLFRLHDALAGIPYEHIILLANTDTYGGGGIFNSYTLTTARHSSFKPVVVHEFGHSFAGLADEYFYDDTYDQMYVADIEPWERNITTMKDFDSKWKNMVGRVYTLGLSGLDWAGRKPAPEKVTVGLHEGGGYQSKGIWRGAEDCRMKTNSYPAFCPVCQKAIRDIIDFYTRE